jgi:hypothetical protein
MGTDGLSRNVGKYLADGTDELSRNVGKYLADGTDVLSRNVGNYESALRNIPEERRYRLIRYLKSEIK